MSPELSITSAGANRAWALDLYKMLGPRPCGCIGGYPTLLDVPHKRRGEENILRYIDPEAVKSAGGYEPEELTVCPQQPVAASDVEQPVTIAAGRAPRAINTIEHGEKILRLKILSDVEQTVATSPGVAPEGSKTIEDSNENMGDVDQTVAPAPEGAPGAARAIGEGEKTVADVNQTVAPGAAAEGEPTMGDVEQTVATDQEQDPATGGPVEDREKTADDVEPTAQELARAQRGGGLTARDEAARRRMSL
jgi:hypothetical protein